MTAPRHIRGSFPILFVKAGLDRGYRVDVDGTSVVLRGRGVFVDGTRMWRVGGSSRRAWIGETSKQQLARAVRGSSGWAVSDGVSTFKLEVRRSEETMGGRFESVRTRRRNGAILAGSEGESWEIGTVALAHHRLKSSPDGRSTHYSGWFEGSIAAGERISLPVAVLAMRLSLGRWIRIPPRTGEWSVNNKSGIG